MTLEERKQNQIDCLKEVFRHWKIEDMEGYAFIAEIGTYDNYELKIFCSVSMFKEGIVVVKINDIEYAVKIFEDMDYQIDCAIAYCEGLANMASILR